MRRARVRLEEEPHKPFEGECVVRNGWLHCAVERRINTGMEFREHDNGDVELEPVFEVRSVNRSWPTSKVRSIDWFEEADAA